MVEDKYMWESKIRSRDIWENAEWTGYRLSYVMVEGNMRGERETSRSKGVDKKSDNQNDWII